MAKTATRTSTKPRCPGTAKTGEPCQATPGRSGWCFFHDPSRSDAEKVSAVRKGGLTATRQPAVLPEAPDPIWSTPEDVERSVVETHGMVTRGELSSDIASVRLRAAATWMQIWESRNLRDQLEALEQLAGAKLQRTWG